MGHISEYEVETKFIDRLESIGYEYIELKNYDDVLANLKEQLVSVNESKIKEAKGEAELSEAEFKRVLIHLDNKSVYESAKILRDKYVLQLDNSVSWEKSLKLRWGNLLMAQHIVIPPANIFLCKEMQI